ncbi:MAG: hypothetical protein R3272_13360 [Candidatus Promineifilaceae bacterium]|nr:hypothetical protein [Candidatus Promineifilaceae bacterium]
MGQDDIYYKVSCVVEDSSYTGSVLNCVQPPQVGDEVSFDGAVFVITELAELMPPTGDFGFLHATVRFVREADEEG